MHNRDSFKGENMIGALRIGVIGGAGCAGLALLAKGFTVPGVTRAVVGFVSGGASIAGITAAAQDPNSQSLEKIANVVGITLFGTVTGIIADSCIEVICPELSIPRAMIVTMLGLGADFVSESHLIPRKHASLLGAMGRISFIAGAILTIASGANVLASSLSQA